MTCFITLSAAVFVGNSRSQKNVTSLVEVFVTNYHSVLCVLLHKHAYIMLCMVHYYITQFSWWT